MNKQEKQWQAESDAYTLLEAENIKLDKIRLGKAKKEVNKLAKEKEKAAKAALKAAKSLNKKRK